MKRAGPTVDVPTLRARLSTYLRQVADGKSITIWDRSRNPIARLVPAVGLQDEEILERQVALGVLQRGIGKPTPRPIRLKRRQRRRVSDAVLDNRE